MRRRRGACLDRLLHVALHQVVDAAPQVPVEAQGHVQHARDPPDTEVHLEGELHAVMRFLLCVRRLPDVDQIPFEPSSPQLKVLHQ